VFIRGPNGFLYMKIAIVGYGRMGRMIERLATERGITVATKLDEYNNANFEGIRADNFHDVDVAIDFSIPSTVVGNIERIAALGVNLVVGTTGWQEQMPHVRSVVEQHGIGLVWSPNYSVGVNAFFRIVSAAAKLLANEPEYEAWAWEIHHSAKKDAPSGTLLKLVEEMREAGYGRNVDVASNRAGAIPGIHEIGFDCAADTITLRHTARSREGFALGAIKAAEWVVGKKGFHEFGDILFGGATCL
jgi:4-hydroxy-tetrahydrodipicolinate reductase